jgi:cytochrome P450
VTKRLETKVERPDIWGIVLKQQEQGRGISLKEMHSNAALFMGAGTETTATELSGLLYYLLKNPSKMANLIQEVRGSFHNGDEITMDRIAQFEYLHACLEEGLRLYPPVPIGLPRIIPPAGVTIADSLVPGGSSVCITQFATYRSPLNFKAPDSFIPERWLSSPSNQTFASDVKSALQPFSYGPRNCLGKNMAYHEMRLVLTKLLWHFDFELCEESKSWAESQKVFALWEKKPLLVKVRVVKR